MVYLLLRELFGGQRNSIDIDLRAIQDYVVGRPGGCEGCVAVYSKFTPFADPAVVRGLMDFNLDCLTRLLQCRVAIDIMPSVWKQVFWLRM